MGNVVTLLIVGYPSAVKMVYIFVIIVELVALMQCLVEDLKILD